MNSTWRNKRYKIELGFNILDIPFNSYIRAFSGDSTGFYVHFEVSDSTNNDKEVMYIFKEGEDLVIKGGYLKFVNAFQVGEDWYYGYECRSGWEKY